MTGLAQGIFTTRAQKERWSWRKEGIKRTVKKLGKGNSRLYFNQKEAEGSEIRRDDWPGRRPKKRGAKNP